MRNDLLLLNTFSNIHNKSSNIIVYDQREYEIVIIVVFDCISY